MTIPTLNATFTISKERIDLGYKFINGTRKDLLVVLALEAVQGGYEVRVAHDVLEGPYCHMMLHHPVAARCRLEVGALEAPRIAVVKAALPLHPGICLYCGPFPHLTIRLAPGQDWHQSLSTEFPWSYWNRYRPLTQTDVGGECLPCSGILYRQGYAALDDLREVAHRYKRPVEDPEFQRIIDEYEVYLVPWSELLNCQQQVESEVFKADLTIHFPR